MTITADNQFLTAETIHEYTNHRFVKFDQMLNLPRFQKLCQSAKLLYTYMLDRLHLSEKNSSRFSDERGLFIFFSYGEVMDKLNCAKEKAAKIMTELENFGLIVRTKCRGSAKKKIYLPAVELTDEEKAQVQIVEAEIVRNHQEALQKEIANLYHWSEDDVSTVVREMFAEFERIYGVGFTPDMVKRKASHRHEFENRTNMSSEIEPPIESDLHQSDLPFDSLSSEEDETEKPEDYAVCLDKANKQVSAAALYGTFVAEENLSDASSEKTELPDKKRQELAAVLAWVYSTPKKSLKISGIHVPIQTVRYKLSQITPQHVTEILCNLRDSRSKIRNRKNYLLTCLFHAADTVYQKPKICENAAAYQSFIYNLN